jgi:hypothetical protein
VQKTAEPQNVPKCGGLIGKFALFADLLAKFMMNFAFSADRA